MKEQWREDDGFSTAWSEIAGKRRSGAFFVFVRKRQSTLLRQGRYGLSQVCWLGCWRRSAGARSYAAGRQTLPLAAVAIAGVDGVLDPAPPATVLRGEDGQISIRAVG